jgi:hypothetical protein
MKKLFFLLILISFNCSLSFAAVSKSDFNKVTKGLINLYSAEFGLRGGTLEIIPNNTDTTPQALSRKTSEGLWQIEVYQGMLDLEHQSIQTLGMMLCHEVGHFLGDGPYVIGHSITAAVRQRAPKKMSCEGQADFYSTSQCFRKLQRIVPVLNSTTDSNDTLSTECSHSFKNKDDIDACLSGLKTAKDLAYVYQDALGKIGIPTSFQNSFSDSITDRTLNYVDEYPTLECRYQTLVHGLLCAEVVDGECVDSKWARPLCWFKD